jgi:hypothetical protein
MLSWHHDKIIMESGNMKKFSLENFTHYYIYCTIQNRPYFNSFFVNIFVLSNLPIVGIFKNFALWHSYLLVSVLTCIVTTNFRVIMSSRKYANLRLSKNADGKMSEVKNSLTLVSALIGHFAPVSCISRKVQHATLRRVMALLYST